MLGKLFRLVNSFGSSLSIDQTSNFESFDRYKIKSNVYEKNLPKNGYNLFSVKVEQDSGSTGVKEIDTYKGIFGGTVTIEKYGSVPGYEKSDTQSVLDDIGNNMFGDKTKHAEKIANQHLFARRVLIEPKNRIDTLIERLDQYRYIDDKLMVDTVVNLNGARRNLDIFDSIINNKKFIDDIPCNILEDALRLVKGSDYQGFYSIGSAEYKKALIKEFKRYSSELDFYMENDLREERFSFQIKEGDRIVEGLSRILDEMIGRNPKLDEFIQENIGLSEAGQKILEEEMDELLEETFLKIPNGVEEYRKYKQEYIKRVVDASYAKEKEGLENGLENAKLSYAEAMEIKADLLCENPVYTKKFHEMFIDKLAKSHSRYYRKVTDKVKALRDEIDTIDKEITENLNRKLIRTEEHEAASKESFLEQHKHRSSSAEAKRIKAEREKSYEDFKKENLEGTREREALYAEIQEKYEEIRKENESINTEERRENVSENCINSENEEGGYYNGDFVAMRELNSFGNLFFHDQSQEILSNIDFNIPTATILINAFKLVGPTIYNMLGYSDNIVVKNLILADSTTYMNVNKVFYMSFENVVKPAIITKTHMNNEISKSILDIGCLINDKFYYGYGGSFIGELMRSKHLACEAVMSAECIKYFTIDYYHNPIFINYVQAGSNVNEIYHKFVIPYYNNILYNVSI